MIIDKEVNSIQRGGIAGERVFGFSFTKKMYDLMSTNLYSDRIGSTVRETCSNAWDAHTAAGKNDVPFQVTLPTTLEPHFIVEDFGTGMPDDKAQDLYSTLGLSTKEQSNDMIGAFGLGSKVPFTVTDSFTVENTYEGKTYYYLCFKNEQGFPSILKTGEVETDKGNGVKVTIPVAGSKYHEFISSMKRQLIMMNPKPIITNAGAFEFEEVVESYSYPAGFMIESSWDHNLNPGHVYAKMGIVLYPIDLDQVGISRHERYHMKFGGSNALVLNFNIGDLDPVPSREGLTYDSAGRTMENIRKVYQEYHDQLCADVAESIKKETETYKAWQMVLDAQAKLGIDMSRVNGAKFEINGYKFGEVIYANPQFKYTITEEEIKDDAGKVIRAARVNNYTAATYKYDSRSRYSWRRKNRWEKDNTLDNVQFNHIKALVKNEIIYILMDDENMKRKTIRMDHACDVMFPGKEIRFIHKPEFFTGDKLDFSDLKKGHDDFYPGLSKKFISFKDVIAPKKEKTKYDATTFKGVKYYEHARGGTYMSDLPKDIDFEPESMFYVTAERDELDIYTSATIGTFRAFCDAANLDFILVRKGGAKSIDALEAEGVREFSVFVNETLTGATFTDAYKNKSGEDRLRDSYINGLPASFIKGLNQVHADVNMNAKNFITNIKMMTNPLRICSVNMNLAERIDSALTTVDLKRYFNEAEWIPEASSDYFDRVVAYRDQFLKDYPFFMLVTAQYVKYPFNLDAPELKQYVEDTNIVLAHKAAQVVPVVEDTAVEEVETPINEVTPTVSENV